LELIGE